ncbi:TPA: tyrosine-type recombinase/integrase, partial [Vibrio cholerae]|nr:tyrosine-type recombinase/integrase [Vibrio cholerae]
MARTTKSLTDKQISNAKPQDKEYTLFDGNGLRLRVKPNGTKTWLFNYTRPHNGKRANMTFGSYPSLSLTNARKKALGAIETLQTGIDPQVKLKNQQTIEQQRLLSTLAEVTNSWLTVKSATISEKTKVNLQRALNLHLLPKLGNTPITELTAPLVINTLQPLQAKGHLETLKRICQRVNEIMSFAQNKGLIEYNPLAKISSAFLKPTVTNMKSIGADELPELMRTLGRASIMYTTRCMIEWQLHTMTRPIKTAQARWDEIDWDENLWVIPADRMKKRRDHLVPLTPQTLNLLNEMKKINGGSEYIFASYKNPMRPSNSQTANIALKRMGFKDRLVSHGLRALASTTLNETKLFHNDVIELALAHVDKNQIRGIYNRALYLNQRREMLRWWSNYIEEAS